MKRAFIYSRVSKQNQDFERQNFELKEYAKRNSIEIVEIFSEKISGRKEERPEMERLIKTAKNKQIDLILVWEFSRLGRTALDVQNKISSLHRLNISIYIHKMKFTTDHTGNDQQSKILLLLLSGIAEMELDNIRDRLQSGRAHYIRNGGKLGRSKESTKRIEETKNYHDIVKYLKKGHTKKDTAQLCNVSLNTVLKIKKHLTPCI